MRRFDAARDALMILEANCLNEMVRAQRAREYGGSGGTRRRQGVVRERRELGWKHAALPPEASSQLSASKARADFAGSGNSERARGLLVEAHATRGECTGSTARSSKQKKCSPKRTCRQYAKRRARRREFGDRRWSSSRNFEGWHWLSPRSPRRPAKSRRLAGAARGRHDITPLRGPVGVEQAAAASSAAADTSRVIVRRTVM